MHLGVWQVIGATEDMADLVMDPTARGRERGGREVGASKHRSTGRQVVRAGHHLGKTPSQHADALFGHQGRDGVRALRIERLDAMGDGIHARRAGNLGRE